MSREIIQYSIVGLAILVIGSVAVWYLWPDARLDPPQVLERRVMEGDSAAVQKKAAEDLLKHGDKARQEVRRTLSGYQQDHVEVKLALIKAAQNIRDWRSMPELFRLMEDPDPQVRGRAGAAARVILGADFMFRAEDPPAKRAAAIVQMKRDYQVMQQKIAEFYVDQTE